MFLVGSFVVNNILKRLHVEIVKEAMEYKLERLNTTLIRSIYNTPIYKQVDVLPGNPTYDKFTRGSHATCYLHNLFYSHRSSLTGLLITGVRVRRWAVTFSPPCPPSGRTTLFLGLRIGTLLTLTEFARGFSPPLTGTSASRVTYGATASISNLCKR